MAFKSEAFKSPGLENDETKSNLSKCKACGNPISAAAERCPYCGQPWPGRSPYRQVVWSTIIALVLFIIFFCFALYLR